MLANHFIRIQTLEVYHNAFARLHSWLVDNQSSCDVTAAAGKNIYMVRLRMGAQPISVENGCPLYSPSLPLSLLLHTLAAQPQAPDSCAGAAAQLPQSLSVRRFRTVFGVVR